MMESNALATKRELMNQIKLHAGGFHPILHDISVIVMKCVIKATVT